MTLITLLDCCPEVEMTFVKYISVSNFALNIPNCSYLFDCASITICVPVVFLIDVNYTFSGIINMILSNKFGIASLVLLSSVILSFKSCKFCIISV